ncbi:MAG: RNA-binding protein [Gammaproteobacteria bacterium]|nr:RNA-binding protein [Gammaproteobacteria bacterium]MXY55415.1 RNA-binding protein [Gammaproteobacteria bacterium]MYF29275.1 RNA-binding protein [Gammaproteobacteria bacterium]MYK46855.1 RNA-binding protein [Gammaproteobacteria bacterium]
MKIYVGNMPYAVTSDELSELFAEHGHVAEANVIMDRETGRSKGFGFVDMPNDGEAKDAINALNSSQMNGRTLRVSEARPRSDRGDRGDRGGDRGDRWRR